MYAPFQKRIITKQPDTSLLKESTLFLVARLPNVWVRGQLGRMSVILIRYGKTGKLRFEFQETLVSLINVDTYKNKAIKFYSCFESEEVSFEHKNIVSLSTEDFLAYIATMSLRIDLLSGDRFNYGPDILNNNINIMDVLTPKQLNPGKTWVAISRHFKETTIKSSPLVEFFNIEANREVLVKELQKQLVVVCKGMGKSELLWYYYAIARAHDWVSEQIGPLEIEIPGYGTHRTSYFVEHLRKEIDKLFKGRQKNYCLQEENCLR